MWCLTSTSMLMQNDRTVECPVPDVTLSALVHQTLSLHTLQRGHFYSLCVFLINKTGYTTRKDVVQYWPLPCIFSLQKITEFKKKSKKCLIFCHTIIIFSPSKWADGTRATKRRISVLTCGETLQAVRHVKARCTAPQARMRGPLLCGAAHNLCLNYWKHTERKRERENQRGEHKP